MSENALGLGVERFNILSDVEREHFWFVARRALLIGLLRRYAPQPASLLLDMGCGPGLNLDYWRAFGDRVVGIDQHRPTAQTDQADMPEIVQGNVTALPFDNRSADIALLLDVLEHVDDAAALSEAYRVLRPGGVLLVAVPAHPWLWGERDEGARHLRRYTRRDLRGKLTSAGFQISAVHPYQFFLMPLLIVSRLIGKLSGKSRDLEDAPSRFVNGVLKWINLKEVSLSLSTIKMPTGSSYIVAARKPA